MDDVGLPPAPSEGRRSRRRSARAWSRRRRLLTVIGGRCGAMLVGGRSPGAQQRRQARVARATTAVRPWEDEVEERRREMGGVARLAINTPGSASRRWSADGGRGLERPPARRAHKAARRTRPRPAARRSHLRGSASGDPPTTRCASQTRRAPTQEDSMDFKVADRTLADSAAPGSPSPSTRCPADGDARAVRATRSAGRRDASWAAAHDHPDRGAHRDPGRARRRGALGRPATSSPPGPRGRRDGRRPNGTVDDP